MKIKPILESVFYHDGRGPELRRVCWIRNGVVLNGFEYYNPGDAHTDANLKNIKLKGVQVFSMTYDEVHPKIVATGKSSAAINAIMDSQWMMAFQSRHLEKC